MGWGWNMAVKTQVDQKHRENAFGDDLSFRGRLPSSLKIFDFSISHTKALLLSVVRAYKDEWRVSIVNHYSWNKVK